MLIYRVEPQLGGPLYVRDATNKIIVFADDPLPRKSFTATQQVPALRKHPLRDIRPDLQEACDSFGYPLSPPSQNGINRIKE